MSGAEAVHACLLSFRHLTADQRTSFCRQLTADEASQLQAALITTTSPLAALPSCSPQATAHTPPPSSQQRAAPLPFKLVQVTGRGTVDFHGNCEFGCDLSISRSSGTVSGNFYCSLAGAAQVRVLL